MNSHLPLKVLNGTIKIQYWGIGSYTRAEQVWTKLVDKGFPYNKGSRSSTIVVMYKLPARRELGIDYSKGFSQHIFATR